MAMSIIDVAKAAGVSTATVSRVLNDYPGVRPHTVRQVKDAIRSLNYNPQRVRPRKEAAPRAPRRRPAIGNIAVITLGDSRAWLQLPVMASVLFGITRAAGEQGSQLLLAEMEDINARPALLDQRRADGAIIFVAGTLHPGDYNHIISTLRQQIPIVWTMGMEVLPSGVDHVAPDNLRAGHLAYQYLHDQGCREVAFITTDPQWEFMRLRGQSFLNAACNAGTPATAYLVTNDSMMVSSYGRRVVATDTLEALVVRLAEASPRPTGLFVGNDRMTAEIYPLLARHGLRVGSDLTVISCDHEEIRLSGLHPRPASIDLGAEQIGIQAVSRLLTRMQHPEEPALVIQIAPRLVPASSFSPFTASSSPAI